jgi:hypothetical protein
MAIFYDWSDDNSREIDKGWIKRGDTPSDLARLINVSPDILDATIGRFNALAEAGEDLDFDRRMGFARRAADPALLRDGIDAELHQHPGRSATQ